MSRSSLVSVPVPVIALALAAAIATARGVRAEGEWETPPAPAPAPAPPACEVRARTAAGWVCGALRGRPGAQYASFRGVPYAKQPLGELRFKELERPEPWGVLNATTEGPICPQTDVLYGKLMQPQGMSEACIHANIHAPLKALSLGEQGAGDQRLPILVFIHGGGFAFGSGDADLHGPKYLVANDVIVITFNYRLNVFGFLSLDSYQVPGNNGLRDMITLLRWVRENARAFGGDPDDVTIAGQSAGAAAAHMLTLSPLAQGLFKKAILMSGTAIPSFYTTSPQYAKYISSAFLAALGINSTDPEETHRILVDMPLEKLMAVNSLLQDHIGLGAFFPVIETSIQDVKAVISEDPEKLMSQGYGSDIPLLIGFTDAECEVFRKRFEDIDIIKRLHSNPLLLLPPEVYFSVTAANAVSRAKQVEDRYSDGKGSFTMEHFIKVCTEEHFQYPAFSVAEYRKRSESALTFMYQFSYDAFISPLKEALGLQFPGAGHIEDLTFVFLPKNARHHLYNDRDERMRKLMAEYVTNFMKLSHPAGIGGDASWRPLNRSDRYVHYQVLHSPSVLRPAEATREQRSMIKFFDFIFSRH